MVNIRDINKLIKHDEFSALYLFRKDKVDIDEKVINNIKDKNILQFLIYSLEWINIQLYIFYKALSENKKCTVFHYKITEDIVDHGKKYHDFFMKMNDIQKKIIADVYFNELTYPKNSDTSYFILYEIYKSGCNIDELPDNYFNIEIEHCILLNDFEFFVKCFNRLDINKVNEHIKSYISFLSEFNLIHREFLLYMVNKGITFNGYEYDENEEFSMCKLAYLLINNIDIEYITFLVKECKLSLSSDVIVNKDITSPYTIKVEVLQVIADNDDNFTEFVKNNKYLLLKNCNEDAMNILLTYL